MVNAQDWLNQNYPKRKRSSIKVINISRQNLVGSLKLEKFNNLEKLDCSDNGLTILDLTKNKNLKEINCFNNNLDSLLLGDNSFLVHLDCSFNDLSNVKFITTLSCPEKLVYLNLRNNCFNPSNLTVFSPFSQLRELYLGTTDPVRVVANTFNDFYGSIKPLQNCQNLEALCISNTEVNYGFEYLPDSLQEIFLADMREKSTGEDLGNTKILAELALFGGDFNKWREEKFLKSEQLPQLIKERDTFQRLTNWWKEKYENSQNNQKITEQELDNVKKELEELQAENENYQEANSLIREKYEKLMTENPQLRNLKELEKLLTQEEKPQAQIQIDTYQKK